MKNLRYTLPIIAAVFLASLPAANASTSINWRISFAQAQTEAQAGNKLIMLDFYTSWCGWCQKLDSDVYTQTAVIAASDQFEPVKVDAEKEGKDLAAKYKVTGYPTILFLQPDGTPVDKIVGYEAPAQFTNDMDQAAQDFQDLPVLQAAVKQRPTDVPSSLKLAALYIKAGDIADAKTLVTTIEQNGGAAQLAPLYTQLGDADSGTGEWKTAAAWYTRALSSTDTQTLVAAHAGLATCDMQQGNKADAKAELLKILTLPGISADLKDRVNQAVNSIS